MYLCQDWITIEGANYVCISYLQGFDQVKIVVGDVIIIAFDFREGFLVFFHQLVNMHILAFFNLMNLLFATQFQILSQRFDLQMNAHIFMLESKVGHRDHKLQNHQC